MYPCIHDPAFFPCPYQLEQPLLGFDILSLSSLGCSSCFLFRELGVTLFVERLEDLEFVLLQRLFFSLSHSEGDQLELTPSSPAPDAIFL